MQLQLPHRSCVFEERPDVGHKKAGPYACVVMHMSINCSNTSDPLYASSLTQISHSFGLFSMNRASASAYTVPSPSSNVAFMNCFLSTTFV